MEGDSNKLPAFITYMEKNSKVKPSRNTPLYRVTHAIGP